MKRIIILTIVAVALLGVVIFLYSDDPVPSSQQESNVGTRTFRTTVTYSDSGFSPKITSSILAIRSGDIIVFENISSKMMWVASGVHPTHKTYPGSGIEKCGTNTPVANFDSCKGYGPGESWEFQFNERGAWKFHNHLQPNHTDTVIIK